MPYQCPNVDLAGIVVQIVILFRGNVRRRSNDAMALSGPNGLMLSAKRRKHVGSAEINQLDVMIFVNQNVLRLQVSMRDSHFMQVRDAAHNLFEVTIDFGKEHLVLGYFTVQVCRTTKVS